MTNDVADSSLMLAALHEFASILKSDQAERPTSASPLPATSGPIIATGGLPPAWAAGEPGDKVPHAEHPSAGSAALNGQGEPPAAGHSTARHLQSGPPAQQAAAAQQQQAAAAAAAQQQAQQQAQAQRQAAWAAPGSWEAKRRTALSLTELVRLQVTGGEE